MSIVFVWVLVIAAYGSGSDGLFSHPVADLESCKRMQTALLNTRTSTCVEIKVIR